VSVLDRLRLVEDDIIEAHVLKKNRVIAQCAVCGQYQIVIVEMFEVLFLSRLPCVVEHAQPGREARRLLLPVEDQRFRDDRERREDGRTEGRRDGGMEKGSLAIVSRVLCLSVPPSLRPSVPLSLYPFTQLASRFEQRKHLNGFAQTHIVGQTSTE